MCHVLSFSWKDLRKVINFSVYRHSISRIIGRCLAMKSSILWWVQRKARRKFDWKFSDFSGRTRGVSGRFQTVSSGSALPRHSVAPPLHKMFSDLKNHVKIFWLFFTFSENWSYGTGRDRRLRDAGRDGIGVWKCGGTGRDGTVGLRDAGRDGTPLSSSRGALVHTQISPLLLTLAHYVFVWR